MAWLALWPDLNAIRSGDRCPAPLRGDPLRGTKTSELDMKHPTKAFGLFLILALLAPLAEGKSTSALRARLGFLERLEEARTAALTLIRDEARYAKGDDAAQREVNLLTEQVEAASRPVEQLLAQDLRKLVRKREALEALRGAEPERLNAWERALVARIRDIEVLEANEKTPRTLPREQRPNAFQLEQLRVTNEYRMLMGERALAFDPQLAAAATGHSEEMVRLRYFDHTSPTAGRSSPTDRAKLAGFGGPAVGENIAMGYRSPKAAHRGWLTSPGHHRNILDRDWEVMGVAYEADHWTQVFGRVTPFEPALE